MDKEDFEDFLEERKAKDKAFLDKSKSKIEKIIEFFKKPLVIFTCGFIIGAIAQWASMK